MPLHRIVYVSTAAPDVDEAAIEDILESARRGNEARNITGFLLSMDGHFMQLLEGPRDAVMETYETILSDPRHSNQVIVLETEGETRCFPDWRMGCHVTSQHADDSNWKERTSSGVASALPDSVPEYVRMLFVSFRAAPGLTIGVQ